MRLSDVHHTMAPMDYRLITGNKEFQAYQRGLCEREVPTVAFDIEGEFNLHVYGERLCLIQLDDGEELAVVDPLQIDSSLLKAFFEHRGVLKIMYDSLSDQALLFKTMGARVHSIIDLKPAVDLLQYESRDLGSVLDRVLGVRIEKKAKFQRYNWTTRPLAADAVTYALSDVAHLLKLKDHLLREVTEKGFFDAYLLKNLMLQNKAPDGERKPRLFRSWEFRRLPAPAKKRFERIHEIRDGYAREMDLPPDMLLRKKQMFEIAAGRMDAQRLESHKRVPREIRDKLASAIDALASE